MRHVRRVPRHLPRRPLWVCQACAELWPCGGAKDELLSLHKADSAELRATLSLFMLQVVDDFREFWTPSPSVLGERMYGWLVGAVKEPAGDTPPSPNDPRWNMPTPRVGMKALNHPGNGR